MVSNSSRTDTPINELPSGTIDAYALFEALTGRRIDRRTATSKTPCEGGYEDLGDAGSYSQGQDQPTLGEEPSPDPRPKDVNVGAINPYAMVEAMIGHRLDRHSASAARIISDTLQTDYDELFDMKHDSVLFAGLKLNRQERRAEELSEKEVRILNDRDLVTPDLSRLQKLDDLERVGLKELRDTRIKVASLQNGKLHLVLNAHSLGKTVCNREVTMTMNELALPFRRDRKEAERWTPPNSSWRNMQEAFIHNIQRHIVTDGGNAAGIGGYRHGREYNSHHQQEHEHRFDDPIQGAAANSWFVAALFSVLWANPSVINRATRAFEHRNMGRDRDRDDERRRNQTLAIRFHDKGGRNNSKTETVDVDYAIPVNNSSDEPIYSRSSNGYELWPSLYEKAFAKWINNNNRSEPESSSAQHRYEHVDITQTHHGDPVKAMAQLNGKEPHYYFTDKHDAAELVGLVRSGSVNRRTITPMAAWTHATGRMYRGANLVANHAYSVLGWVSRGQEEKQYIVVRNPWGVTEPHGFTSYPGLLDRVEPEFWGPASLCDRDGVLAVEASAFKEYFACIGVAK